MRHHCQYFFARVRHQLGDVAPLALGVVAATNFRIEDFELCSTGFGQTPRPIEGFHCAGDGDRDDEKGDDLETFHPIDAQRSARRQEAQVYKKQRYRGRERTRPWSSVPRRNGDGRHEKQKARCWTIAPK